MTTTVPSQELLPSLPLTQPRKQTHPAPNPRKSGRARQARSLCRDLPLRQGVESLERWLDLNA